MRLKGYELRNKLPTVPRDDDPGAWGEALMRNDGEQE